MCSHREANSISDKRTETEGCESMRGDRDPSHHLLADGRDRAREALAPRIRAEVEREFASELESAGPVRRFRLRRKMKREIER